MPARDGTGPMGTGRGTGRGMGRQAGGCHGRAAAAHGASHGCGCGLRSRLRDGSCCCLANDRDSLTVEKQILENRIQQIRERLNGYSDPSSEPSDV